MRLDERLMSPMVWTTAPMASLPRRATSLARAASPAASRADVALLSTVLVSSSIEAAVCSRLLAWASVRADRSWLPPAISPEATCTPSTSWRTSVTTAIRFTLSWFRARISSPISSVLRDSCRADRSPAAILLANASTSPTGATSMRFMNAAATSDTTAVAATAARCTHSGEPSVALSRNWTPNASARVSSASLRPRVGRVHSRSLPRQPVRTRWPRRSATDFCPDSASARMRA